MITGFELPFWVELLISIPLSLLFYIICYWIVEASMDISKINEVVAKVWPFGTWDVTWESSEGKPLKRDILLRKEKAVEWYFRYTKSSLTLKNVRLMKVGGFLNGIKIKPRPRKGTRKE